jgi:hypothetical protein
LLLQLEKPNSWNSCYFFVDFVFLVEGDLDFILRTAPAGPIVSNPGEEEEEEEATETAPPSSIAPLIFSMLIRTAGDVEEGGGEAEEGEE